jgi:hypothetical protein
MFGNGEDLLEPKCLINKLYPLGREAVFPVFLVLRISGISVPLFERGAISPVFPVSGISGISAPLNSGFSAP